MRLFIVVITTVAASHFGMLDHWQLMALIVLTGILALLQDLVELTEKRNT